VRPTELSSRNTYQDAPGKNGYEVVLKMVEKFGFDLQPLTTHHPEFISGSLDHVCVVFSLRS